MGWICRKKTYRGIGLLLDALFEGGNRMLWKMEVVVLSLGLYNLLLATSVGASDMKQRPKIWLLLALSGAVLPAAGLLAGQAATAWMEEWGFYVGILALLGLGVYFLLKESDEGIRLIELRRIWTFNAAAFYLCGFLIGLAFGILKFPLSATLIIIFVQTVLFSVIGFLFGRNIHRYLSGASEKLLSIALMMAAVFVSIQHWFSA